MDITNTETNDHQDIQETIEETPYQINSLSPPERRRACSSLLRRLKKVVITPGKISKGPDHNIPAL